MNLHSLSQGQLYLYLFMRKYFLLVKISRFSNAELTALEGDEEKTGTCYESGGVS
jgi:hypothetical protein